MSSKFDEPLADGVAQPGRLTSLSQQVIVVWGVSVVALPFVILMLAGQKTPALVAVSVGFTALSIMVGILYGRRVRIAWHLMQADMVLGALVAGALSHRWFFVFESLLMIYLYFSLYAPEVKKEFDIHTAPREVGVLLVLLGMCALLTFVRPQFLAGGNLMDLARQFSMVGIMAVGMTMVIILGGIDLSVGSIVGLSGCLAVMAMSRTGHSIWVVLSVSLGVGAAVGLLNGGLISGLRMPPFIITLGTMSMARSLANVVTGGYPAIPKGPEAEKALSSIAGHYTLGVPNPVWLMAVVVFLGHVFLTRTRTGRHIYYIGANEEAGRLSGLNVTAVKWWTYSICGLLAGLAGAVQASRLASGQPTAGTGDELRVIAAVIIGGASFSGGVGTVLGALLGAAIMGVLRQGLVLMEVEAYWQKFLEGTVIIGAVALDMLRRRR